MPLGTRGVSVVCTLPTTMAYSFWGVALGAACLAAVARGDEHTHEVPLRSLCKHGSRVLEKWWRGVAWQPRLLRVLLRFLQCLPC